MKFICWFFVVDGITTIVTTSILFQWFRNQKIFYQDDAKKTKTMLGKLFHCPMCFGFWMGGLIFLLDPFLKSWGSDLALVPGPSLLDLHLSLNTLFAFFWSFLFNGAAGASICWSVHLIRMKINESLNL